MLGSKFWRHVDVEPSYFLFFVATEMMGFLRSNLYLQKTCRPTLLSEPDLSTACADEKRGQEFVAEVCNSVDMVSSWISMLATLMLVSYSDWMGRKRRPFILISIGGTWLQSVSEMLQAYFWNWPPLLGAILGTFLPDLAGGWATVVVFCNLLIYEKSSPGNRHVALTGIIVLERFARLTARASVGHLLRGVGFFYSFAVCFGLITLAVVGIFAFVRENKPDTVECNVGQHLRHLFNFGDILKSVRVILFSEKSLKHRAAIWLLQILTALVYFNLIGEQSVFYLYFRYRYHWDEKRFSNYTAYRTVVGIIGSLLCTLIMSKLLKIHDSIIGAFAAFMDTLASLGYFYAVQDWEIYSVPILDILHGIALSTCFSLASKFFTEEDFGRLNTVHVLFDLSIGLSYPTYSFLFKSTMDTLPNAFFLLSVLLNFIIFVIYGYWGTPLGSNFWQNNVDQGFAARWLQNFLDEVFVVQRH